jgi:hypothetical protein
VKRAPHPARSRSTSACGSTNVACRHARRPGSRHARCSRFVPFPSIRGGGNGTPGSARRCSTDKVSNLRPRGVSGSLSAATRMMRRRLGPGDALRRFVAREDRHSEAAGVHRRPPVGARGEVRARTYGGSPMVGGIRARGHMARPPAECARRARRMTPSRPPSPGTNP